MAKKVISIRVEDKSTMIVFMEYGSTNPLVEGCVRVTTPPGTVEDGMIVDVFAIGRRISKAIYEMGFRTKDVVFTIASSKIANREIQIPVVPKNKIQQVVDAKITDYFPVDTSKYTFAYSNHGTEKTTEEGKMMDLLVFAAPNELIESYYALADSMNMNIAAIDCDGNSVFQIMKRQIKSGVAMAVQINRLNTMVNIMAGDKLLLQRIIPYGIAAVTEHMLADSSFNVSTYEDAYNLIANNQVLLTELDSQDNKADASFQKRVEVTNKLTPLVNNLIRVMEYYNSRNNKEGAVTEVICSGSGASVVGIHELLDHELGVHTSTPSDLKGVKFTKNIYLDRSILQYVGCFGAVMDPVGFISKDIVEKVEKKNSTYSMAIVFGCGMVIAIALCVVSIAQFFSAQSARDDAQAKLDALKPTQERYNQMMSIKAKTDVYDTITQFVDTKQNKAHAVLEEIARKAPKSFYIKSYAVDDLSGAVSCVTPDRLSSIAVLKMKLDSIEAIDSVYVHEIQATVNEQGKKEYNYSISFNFSGLTQYDVKTIK